MLLPRAGAGNPSPVPDVKRPMHRNRSPIALLLLVLAALAALAGCGDDAEDVGTADGGDGSGSSTDSTPPPDARPGGTASGLFIEVASVGGFVPSDFAFRSVPRVVVYDDGTVIAPGAVPAIYPGPATTPLFSGTLDAAALHELLAAAAAAGLIGGTPDVGDQGDIPIADAPSTRVTVVVDGDERVVEAYALVEAGADMGQTGLSDEQLEARAALAELVALADRAVLAAETPYEPARYRVLGSEPPADPGTDVAPNELAWPEGVPEPIEATCVSIGGDAAAGFAATLASASEITRWSIGDRVLNVAVRPVLPHEPDCPVS